MSRFALYGVKAGATFLGDISQQSVGAGADWARATAGSEIYSRFQSMISQGFTPSFSTGSIEAALTVIGVTGTSIADMSGGLVFLFQKRKDQGDFEAITELVHRTYAFAYGYAFPQQLSVNHRGEASLSYGAIAKSADGSTSPLVVSTGVAITGTKATPERWALGDVSLGGKTLTGIEQLTIDFGLKVMAKSNDDHIYDTEVNLHQVDPMITLSGKDLAWNDSTNIPPAGLVCSHANTSLDLRKRADGGNFVASTSDITFTAKGVAYPTTLAEAGAGDDATTAVQLQCDYDGTNAPLTVTL